MKLRVLPVVLGISAVFSVYSADASSLLGYYDFNNSNLQDSSGSGNDGVPAANSPTFVSGIGGDASAAAQFNGSLNEFFTIPVDLNDYTNFTFGAWVYVSSAPTVPPFYGIISADSHAFQATIDIDTRAGSTGYSAFAGDDGDPGQVVGGMAVIPGQWQFVAASYDNADGTLILDVDGTMVSAYTDFWASPNSTLDVGRSPCCDQPFTGYMDNVFLSDTAMDASQLNDLQAQTALSQSPEPGSIALFGIGAAAVALGRFRRKRA